MGFRIKRSCAAVLALGAGAAIACTGSKATELVPGVMTQIQVPKDLKTIRIDIQPQGQQSTCIIHGVDPANPGFITLPSTLGVVPGAGPNRLVTITVTGYSKAEGEAPATQDCATPPSVNGKYNEDVRLLRRSRLSYVGDKVLFLPMPLKYSCWDAKDCPEDQTCKAGQCVPADVDPSTLTEYRDDLIAGTTNTCFSTKTCFGDRQPAKLIDAASCTYGFTVPDVAVGKGLNVQVFYDQDGAESEVLDVDPDEGFTADPSNPKQFKLAPGLCDLVKTTDPTMHHIYAVNVASLCPSKTVLQPMCAAESDPSSAPLPDGGTSTDGRCNVAKPLVPAPSALYVLMDNASSMGSYFGPTGLNAVLGFSLGDPIFRTTSLAFKLLPHDGADCTAPGATSVGTPDVAFGLAAAVQAPVGAIVGDMTKVLGTSPPLYVDAALRPNGAYGTLSTFASGKAFNRVALMLIVNRPALSDCGGAGLVPSDEAQAAAQGPLKIATYVVALHNDGGDYDVTELTNIATKSGGAFFDARNDATVGAQAFDKVESDLGSCLYEKPSDVVLDTSAEIHYGNPLAPGAPGTTVAFDAGCSAANATSANGWNFDGNRVRICGQACTDLQSTLKQVADVSLFMHQTPPDVPVTATQKCQSGGTHTM